MMQLIIYYLILVEKLLNMKIVYVIIPPRKFYINNKQ